jgi:methylthioribose-1-phosphate isomerase
MTVDGEPQSVLWQDGCIVAVDQVALPHHERRIRITRVDQLIATVSRLAIRGAPSLAAAGALGVLLSAHSRRTPFDAAGIRADAARLAAARPTAVNLRWAIDRMLAVLDGGYPALEREADAVLGEIVTANAALASATADFVCAATARHRLRVLTHCNTGWLATLRIGTALGAVLRLHERGRLERVYCTETRPLLQGARLTCWELDRAEVPHALLVDSAAAAVMARGAIDCVIVGADRIAANRDTANKVGTLALAIAARHHGIPFVVAAPTSTIDEATPSGAGIPIEHRYAEEVTHFGLELTAPRRTEVENPAFDVTPGELVSAVITEHGVYRPGG